MNDLIEKLSNLRSQFNCFNENERDAYHTLSEVIKVLSEQPEPCEDAVSRKAAIDALNAYEDVVDTASQVFTIRGCKKAITNLPSVQPERYVQWER